MALTIYRSTDVGAPTVPYGSGNVIKLLDACLRTGYGAKAGAGWTKPFVSGTTVAVFKQGGGQNRCLRVWDARTTDDPNTYALTALVRGYETMTAISTGTGPFPTTAQSPGNGLMVRSSISYEPPNPPAWILRANSTWFDLLISSGYHAPRGSALATYDGRLTFGSFISMKSGDLYNDMISAEMHTSHWPYWNENSLNGEMFVSRSDTGVIGSKEAKLLNTMLRGEGGLGTGYPYDFPYPNRTNNTVLLNQYIIHCDGYPRGTLPGVWGTPHGVNNLGTGNTFGGNSTLAGRTFEIIGYGIDSATGVILETSDTFTGV